MLNIISLTALREKITGPGKVVKNLMKGLDQIGYPYVLNHDLSSTNRLWIHDDTFALSSLSKVDESVEVILGPNLYALPRHVPKSLPLEKYIHIMPSLWVVYFWKHFGYHGPLDVWPVGIDTELFYPMNDEKTDVLIYFKQRPREDLEYVIAFLHTQGISYTLLEYTKYDEQDFLSALSRARYAIWIGCSESQGIAFGETLASGVPILVWDITRIADSDFPGLSLFTREESQYTPVTSAPYFDARCGIIITDRSDIMRAIDTMEEEYLSYTPREYIMEHMTLAIQAKNFIALYEKHFGQEDESTLRNTRKFRNNIFIRFAFRLYDSRLGMFIRKLIKR